MRRHTIRGFKYEEGSPMESLQEFEDMLEDGLLLKAPCKVGDKFYSVLSEFDDWSVEESEIIGICYEKDQWYVESVDDEFWAVGTEFCLLDRAEAERVLRRKEAKS